MKHQKVYEGDWMWDNYCKSWSKEEDPTHIYIYPPFEIQLKY